MMVLDNGNNKYEILEEEEYGSYCKRFSAKWKSRFRNPKFYRAISNIVGIFEGAFITYFIGVITTIEKRFEFDSLVTGIILIANSLCGMLVSFALNYFPWESFPISSTVFSSTVVSMSCFMCTVPYFLYGPAIHLLPQQKEDISSMITLSLNHEVTEPAYFVKYVAIIMFFIANFLRGLGNKNCFLKSVFYPEEVNTQSSDISAMAALRIFGPTIGFLLSSFCLKYYEDPFYDPGIDPHNPRWVGAWWMGFFILGAAILVFTVLLALFPKELPERFRSEKKELKDELENDNEMPKLKDFPQAIKRLMKNPILVCHVISITFQVNGFAGYFVFMPKFMEAQYQQSASEASLFSGATGILSMLLGVLLGGFLIKKFKPRPRYLTGYMVIVEIFSVIGLFVSIFLGCDRILMPGTNVNEDQTLNLYNECNAGCGCTRKVFEPVCGADGVSSFFSPCFAGCPNTTGMISSAIQPTITSIKNATVFTDCKCVIGSVGNSTFEVSNVVSGFCSTGCTMFIAYIIMLCISKFVSSTARVGNTLITFRCVDAKDKSFALGVFGSVLAMFAFIPYPLIYGALTDSTCLVWEESCSKTGNCWLYDSDKFRYYLHGMSMLLISIGICFDIIVFFLSDRLTNFYGEDDEDKPSAERIARWIKDEEEEDIIFTKRAKKEPVVEMDPIM